MDEELGGLQSMESQRVGQGRVTSLLHVVITVRGRGRKEEKLFSARGPVT